MKSLRSLPRVFVPGAPHEEPFELPSEELDKFRKVLRLASGDPVAVLPNDGALLVGKLDGRRFVPERVERPDTEPRRRVTVLQALPKAEKAEEIVRAGTEIGVAAFVFFPSDRTVVRWDDAKVQAKLRRLATIARESAEVSFRTRVPQIGYAASFAQADRAEAIYLSEGEDETALLPVTGDVTFGVGPEGGWSPAERERIGGRGVTLGPRVLRVEHAAPAAAALLLLASNRV